MKILWFTWKDLKHPQAGGAEVVNEELSARLAKDGHSVILVVGGFSEAKKTENVNGYQVVRLGNRWNLYWKAYRYYKKNLVGWADLVIDEVNTVPFFAKFYVKEKNILFVHQLCRQIWFYQLPLPLSLIGWLLEPLYLRLLADRLVITVSESTKRDLQRYGYDAQNISIISEGVEIEPAKKLSNIQKFKQPTLLSFGAVRPMKRTSHQLRAFEIAKKLIPDLRLIVAGDTSGRYGQKLLKRVEKSVHKADVDILGRVSREQKIEIMRKSHLILVTSIKEGWGLVVTEANSQGTPAIVYDVDGLRDSVKNNYSGYVISRSSPDAIASKIKELIYDTTTYQRLRRKGWLWSQEISFEKSYSDLIKILNIT